MHGEEERGGAVGTFDKGYNCLVIYTDLFPSVSKQVGMTIWPLKRLAVHDNM
jgi:hypothetical protein